MIGKKNDVRDRIMTMVIIENLPINNVDHPNNLLSYLPIRDNSVVLSLTGSSGKVASRRKGERINRR